MELNELISYRQQLLDESKDADGYIADNGFLENCIPALNETRHIDTTDVNDVYCLLDGGNVKINAYTLNESEERLQLFIVNEDALAADASEEQLLLSQKSAYERHFNRAVLFVKKSIKRQLNDQLQGGSSAWVLVDQLATSAFVDQIDVVEIFLISATVTVQRKTGEISPRTMEFEDENIEVSFTRNKEKYKKELIIMRRLIDVNFLYNVYITQESREPLTINFNGAPYNYSLPCLRAADETHFDSYLSVLPASLLAELYKRHSGRLLEKNVRSFLQLKGVNKGMQETIRREPEKFIAYNNGLTITATDGIIKQGQGISHIHSLTDFQIVNGGQTTATLYFSHKLGMDISGIRVMAKINVAKEATDDELDDLISNISTYSNAQSKVSKVDLRARSPQLVRIKSLSESILTVSGKKWFFERAKGEYATMLRINSGKKAQIEKAFPKERRFAKEELAKYHAAWGDKPFAVKKGGEKIFRLFLEELSGEGKTKKVTVINRVFYEDLIARVILFRGLEEIHGVGAKALGQLRSAVVPYSLSVIYLHTTGNKKSRPFDLLKIWKAEKLEEDLQGVFRKLMELMNNLIKKYSKSDDLGEYSKKHELWEMIAASKEIASFVEAPDVTEVLRRYTISPEEMRKREKDAARSNEVDFDHLLDMTEIFDRGVLFYQSILIEMSSELTVGQQRKIETIIVSIQQRLTPDESLLNFEKQLIKKIIVSRPVLLDKIDKGNDIYTHTGAFLIKKYNDAVMVGESVQSAFDVVKELALKKGARYHSVFHEIGRLLENGQLPSMQQINQAAEYCKMIRSI